MSGVRVLVGTRKGAFVLTSDAKRDVWDIRGPLFAGWEIYYLKGSPADPNSLYASQSSGWFGQLIQRSNDGGLTSEPAGNAFVYDGVPGTTARRTPGPLPGSGISNRRCTIRIGYAHLGPKPNSCSARVVRCKDGSVWHATGVGLRRQAM